MMPQRRVTFKKIPKFEGLTSEQNNNLMMEDINKGMSRPKSKLTDNDYSTRFSYSKIADSSQDISGTKFESRLTLNPDNREPKKSQLIYVQDGNSNKNLKYGGL